MTSDRDLLGLGVAVKPDDFHPVEEWSGNGVDHVGRRHEHHARKIEVDLEVVISKGVVLRRVEDLQQRGRRVATKVRTQFVDLVEDDDGIHGAGFSQRTNKASGLGTDVGATMPSYLRLVANATE